MSSVYTTRVIISSALLMLLIVAGIFIHRTGKPYNSLVFGIHKIFTITLIVILVVITSYSIHYTKLYDKKTTAPDHVNERIVNEDLPSGEKNKVCLE